MAKNKPPEPAQQKAEPAQQQADDKPGLEPGVPVLSDEQVDPVPPVEYVEPFTEGVDAPEPEIVEPVMPVTDADGA